MPEGVLENEPGIRFVVQDHDKIMDTVDVLVGTKEACHFCGAAPIVIVYRGWDDKITAACEYHREIVEEMVERDSL